VHLGHREILSGAVRDARERDVRALVITFDPHPEQFLRPDVAPKMLTPIPERLRLLVATGVDAILVLPFNPALAGMRAEEFVQRVLVETLHVCALHEGGNFRFGYRAEAGVEELRAFGAKYGFAVHVHPSVRVHGLEISSSVVRGLVATGDMKRARWMLGRPFSVRSTPARGRGVGTRLLVPTVNLAAYETLLPAFGVYVTRLTVGSRCFQAVTNVGNRPTFEGVGFGVETHILNFEPIDLNEETQLELEFLLRLRGEVEWPSPEALKAQIFKDVARAKRYFRLRADA
jgi:riboflavin kinase/FMN adenylyltransferase